MAARPLPITAPRAWPMCKGPVGLTLTNSTCTERPLPVLTRPNESPSARIASTCDASQFESRDMFTNPGGPADAEATRPGAEISAAMASAMAIGFMRIGLARRRATLEA